MSDKFGEKRIEHGMIQEKTSKDITDNKKYNYINEDIVNDLGLLCIIPFNPCFLYRATSACIVPFE